MKRVIALLLITMSLGVFAHDSYYYTTDYGDYTITSDDYGNTYTTYNYNDFSMTTDDYGNTITNFYYR